MKIGEELNFFSYLSKLPNRIFDKAGHRLSGTEIERAAKEDFDLDPTVRRKALEIGNEDQPGLHLLLCLHHHGYPYVENDPEIVPWLDSGASDWKAAPTVDNLFHLLSLRETNHGAEKELRRMVADEVARGIKEQEKRLESRLREQLREELIPQLRDELLPRVREELLRELESGEIFGPAAQDSVNVIEWCMDHRDLLEAYPNTNVAIDLDNAAVALADADDWKFAQRLNALEQESGKQFPTVNTGALTALIDASGH